MSYYSNNLQQSLCPAGRECLPVDTDMASVHEWSGDLGFNVSMDGDINVDVEPKRAVVWT